MKNTRKISIVLVLVMVLMMTLAVIPSSAANMTGGEKLYLVPSANWNQSNARFAAYFFGTGEAWVSMTKVAGESNLYEVTVPSGNWTNVIFCRMNPSASANNWNNKWNQTSDLVYNGTSNCYTVKEGTWDKGGGTWSSYGNSCTHANVGAAATCTTDQVCLDCGDPVVTALGHTYNASHLCTRCNGQAAFTVAGSGAHLGTEWDTGNTANDMTYADGVYTKVYTNVAAGSYLLKVVRDHDWGTAYPDADKSYTVATAGSTVTVTLKGTAVTITVEAPHTHSWSDATCTEPQKCECGETQGEALGHTWENCACACGQTLPTLGANDSFDFSTQAQFDEIVAGGKLGFVDSFRDNGGSFQFNTNSSIQFVAPANTVVTVTGHSAQYGVFNIYLNGEKAALTANNGVYSFAVSAETKVVIATGDDGASYSYIKSIALAEYVDRTISSDTTITFGSEGNYKASVVDFSGIQIGDNGGDNSQVKNGSFELLLKAGAKVTIHGYPGYTSYKLNDGDEITEEYYTYTAIEDTTLVVTPVNGNNYFYSIEIVYHTHTWADATCEAPKTCTGCGETEGEALGHTYYYNFCLTCYAPNPYYIANSLVVGENKVICNEYHLVGDGQNGNHTFPYEFVLLTVTEDGTYNLTGDMLGFTIFTIEVNTEGADFSNTGASWGAYVVGGTAELKAGTYYVGLVYIAGQGEYTVNVAKAHEHSFVDGKCECGESDPNYVPPHEHEFVEGKCECGETDPDYVAPDTGDNGNEGDSGETPAVPDLGFFQKLWLAILAFIKKLFGLA